MLGCRQPSKSDQASDLEEKACLHVAIQVPEINETYLCEGKQKTKNDVSQLRILSNMMEKETHVDSMSSGEQADICQILFDIVEDQSDVHRRAVKETAISGHPQSDQLRSGKPAGEPGTHITTTISDRQSHDHQITDNRNSIKFLDNMFGVLLSDLNRYLLLYESILSELDHFLDALDNLSNNQLSHSVVSAEVMQVLIAHVQQVLERDYPDYELVVSQVHDYYNLPISTFACKDKTLVIHISFYIKPRNQEPLFLYDIRTIPVPYHMNEELIDESESKYTYTKVKPTTRILAMGSNTQINLDYDQLVHCVKYNILFFCE